MSEGTRPTGGDRLVVVSGPSGVGKGTVVAALRRRLPEVEVSVSATTRAPRPGEVEGRDYRFLDEESFDRLVAEGAFLEWARFNTSRYGTPWSSVSEALERGSVVVLEIDVQGARLVRDRYPSAVLVFLRPPDDAALRDRLEARGVDDPEEVARRVDIARWELERVGEFDHVVVNDEVARAADELARIIRGTFGPTPRA